MQRCRSPVCAAAASAAPLRSFRRWASCAEVEAPSHVYVVGAGAVGVTSAYSIASRGVPVTLLDGGAGPASACSSVNAGSLRHSSRGLITQPAKLLQFVNAAIKGDAVFHLHHRELLSDATFWRFAGPYLWATIWKPWRRRNQEFNNATSKWYADVVEELMAKEGVGDLRHGVLIINTKPLGPQAPFGPECGACHALTADEAVALEPLLAEVKDEITGALHLPEDRFAHCGDFIRDLAAVMQQKYGVQCRYGAKVDSLLSESGKVSGIALTEGGHVPVAEGEAVVVCAGADTPALLEPLGVRTPVFPMKGYSLTANVPEGQVESMPSRMLIFEPAHTYVTPYSEGRLRFASVAEFGGSYDPVDASSIPPTQGDELLEVVRGSARSCTPSFAALLEPGAGAKALCGARPQSADDLPLVGRAPRHENLWMNVGHGQYGWKLSLGSAEILATKLLGLESPVPDPAALDPARFDLFQAPWRRWGWGLPRAARPQQPPAPAE